MFKNGKKDLDSDQLESRSQWSATRKIIVAAAISLVFAVVVLAIGLGVGLTRHHNTEEDISTPTDQIPQPNATSSNNATSTYNGWQPTSGTTWQIELPDPLTNTTLDVEVYDIDLLNNTAATIADLHSKGRKVICYFSAGSYEDWSPDRDQFVKETDMGKPLDGWPGEWWLNTTSENVRRIMRERLDIAVKKGCDGVDPDNVDAYDNDNGLGLTSDDAIDYVTFLANVAHDLHLAIGLKNSGMILPQVEPQMQWSVNEQCVQYDECAEFRTFVSHGKPVFHIEYPEDAPSISGDDQVTYCNASSANGFSTILKKMELDDWIYACPIR